MEKKIQLTWLLISILPWPAAKTTIPWFRAVCVCQPRTAPRRTAPHSSTLWHQLFSSRAAASCRERDGKAQKRKKKNRRFYDVSFINYRRPRSGDVTGDHICTTHTVSYKLTHSHTHNITIHPSFFSFFLNNTSCIGCNMVWQDITVMQWLRWGQFISLNNADRSFNSTHRYF